MKKNAIHSLVHLVVQDPLSKCLLQASRSNKFSSCPHIAWSLVGREENNEARNLSASEAMMIGRGARQRQARRSASVWGSEGQAAGVAADLPGAS